jgi:hypothetical protein
MMSNTTLKTGGGVGRRAFAALAALGLLLAACGGTDAPEVADPAPPAAGEPADTPQAPVEAGSAEAWCMALADDDFLAEIDLDLEETDEIARWIAEFDRLAAMSPAEVRGDVEALSGWYRGLLELMEEHGDDSMAMAQDDRFQELMAQTEDFYGAMTNLAAYAMTNCAGLDLDWDDDWDDDDWDDDDEY